MDVPGLLKDDFEELAKAIKTADDDLKKAIANKDEEKIKIHEEELKKLKDYAEIFRFMYHLLIKSEEHRKYMPIAQLCDIYKEFGENMINDAKNKQEQACNKEQA